MPIKSLALFGVVSLALGAHGAIASEKNTETFQKVSIVEKMDDFTGILKVTPLDYQQLETTLEKVYSKLENLDPSRLDFVEIRKNTSRIVRTSTLFREELKQKIEQWKNAGLWTLTSETTVRNIMRALRYFEDAAGEHSINAGNSKDKKMKIKSFIGGEPMVVTGDGSSFSVYHDVKPGDVILMRGSSEISAAIARVADVNTQFSHLAIVTQDPQTQKLYLAEALIEKGLIVSPIEEFINHGYGRAVIYRNEDPALAALADQKAWQRSHDGTRYEYDFSMNMNRTEDELKVNPTLFCSMVVKDAFETADPNFLMPLSPSKITPKNRDFLRRIGVKDQTTEVFEPGDMELDYRFFLVAEFRNLTETPVQRIYDTIFDKVFQWMDDGGQLEDYKVLGAVANTVHFLASFEPLKKQAWKFGMPVSGHVQPLVLKTVAAMAFIRLPLHQEIKPKLDAYQMKYGVIPPPRVISGWLDEIRAKNENNAFRFLNSKSLPR